MSHPPTESRYYVIKDILCDIADNHFQFGVYQIKGVFEVQPSIRHSDRSKGISVPIQS